MNDRKIRDNDAKASIHFAKAEQIAFYHNSREAFLPETSNEELRAKNECDKTAEEARALFEELSAKADENFLKNTGRRTNMKAKNKLWESVMNLRGRHTMADVQRVNARIAKETGFIPVQTSIHRDEGHVDEKTGDFIQNIHAQTLWLTQDPETGKSLAYRLYDKKDVYRKIQDVVAEELGMTRGKPAEITGAKHFKNMRTYKEVKRAEGKLNKEWEQKLAAKDAEWQEKLAQNNARWEQKKAAWEAKQAEREARKEEWERKIPEIIAARERRSKFISDKLDWESARDGKKIAYEMEMLGISFAGVSNPSGNIIIEAQKDAIRNIFYMLGTTAQLAVFLMQKTLQNDEKIKSDAKIFNVESTLLRAVDYVANSDPANGEELKKRIRRTFLTIPEDKRRELFEYAVENAPTEELRNDIKALVEGRFEDIAKSAAAQKRIENRDLRQALREYSEELKRIKEELRAMDEENRVLNLAEREILKSKGAGREEYAERESENRKRREELKRLKDEAKLINNDLRDQKQSPDKDAKTIAEQADKIKELNAQIAEITEENAKKQKELEEELKQEKAARKTAEIITPQMLQAAFEKIDELEGRLKEREEPKPEPLKRSDGSEQSEAKPKPEPEKIEQPKPEEPKYEPEPKREEPKKADDFTNIYGYERPKPEPRRRFGDEDFKPRPREDDRPKYEPEPEPIREPEPEPEPFRDPWQKIENEIEKWKKCESEVEKNLLKTDILEIIEKYEKNGVPPHRRMSLDSYIRALSPNPAADAEALRKMRELELEKKRRAAAELEKKYDDDVKKSVKQDTNARQTTIKKKKDELEMGMS